VLGGKREGSGRKPGVPNKLNRDIKEMVLGALSDVGGREYLAARAIDTPAAFLTLVGKILPLQLVSEGGSNHLHLHLEAAQRVSAQLQAEPKRRVTIEHEQQAAPSGSLLDAPLPEE
jgi:hypothetical protein